MNVAFGTSGLRGSAEGFTPALCHGYIRAFLERFSEIGDGRDVFIGGDLRHSTPTIAGAVMAAVRASGWNPVWAGNVPTPALAVYAMDRACPAIMVTGSHIPETYNGIKFYRPDGEFLKEDEAPVRNRAEEIIAQGHAPAASQTGPADPAVAASYVTRYVNAFGANALSGLKIGVDLHSAVGRDLVTAILTALGGDLVAFRRSDRFIAVDTEALDPEDVRRASMMIGEHGLVAVVSTDGDGDRPLVIDETGSQINGDVLGALTAHALGIACVVTPLSSTSAIEQSGWFAHVERTKIGSPFVVAGMGSASVHPVAGFEANGGFLLGDDLALDHGPLSRLPTRDAMLPIIVVLMAARQSGKTLSQLAATLPARFMKADRLKDVPAAVGQSFIDQVETSRSFRIELDRRLADPTEISRLDGVRMAFANGSTVHFRQSGNAPELRIYVETGARDHTQSLLADLVARMTTHLRKAS